MFDGQHGEMGPWNFNKKPITKSYENSQNYIAFYFHWQTIGSIRPEDFHKFVQPFMPTLTPAPDGRPRKPAFLLPPGAIDSHFHAFGPPEKYPFHPQSKYTSERSSIDEYFHLQTALGLSRGVFVSGGGYGPDFRYLADTLRIHSDRLRGVALLPENVSTADLKQLDSTGVRGARFASPAHGGVMPVFSKKVARLVADFNWHIQYYPHASDFIDMIPKLMDLPNIIVLDHFASIPAAGGVGQPAFKMLLKMLDTGRVWVKLSGPMRCTEKEPPYRDLTPIARALVAHAPDRLVWGSDWPHVNMNGRTMPNDGDLLDELADWIPDENQRNKVLVENPSRLYGF
ncbi:amidohydrolase family protein [Xylophilus sp. GW821-FHT01B05]